MILKLETTSLQDYLDCTAIVDFDQQDIQGLASRIADASGSKTELVKNCYEFVRDEVSHSADIEGKTVTCTASEVLEAREGLCYAKSHLLAALLRCNNVPTGFCYQLLRSPLSPDAALVLHGLVAVYIQDVEKWVRLDARGNKPGIDARFSIDHEQLAYQVHTEKGEVDFAVVFAAPDENVVNILEAYKEDMSALWENLPGYPAKMEWCKTLDQETARRARLDANLVGYCGHHCAFCFLRQWCGGCRSEYNHCSYAVLCDGKTCPNVQCAKEQNLKGCYECAELEDCAKGYYERSDEFIAKASALFIKKHGEGRYAKALTLALQNGVHYPESFDSSGSVEKALGILEKYL